MRTDEADFRRVEYLAMDGRCDVIGSGSLLGIRFRELEDDVPSLYFHDADGWSNAPWMQPAFGAVEELARSL